MWTCTVASEPMDLGLLGLLSYSWWSTGERSPEAEIPKGGKPGKGSTLRLTGLWIEGRRWGKSRRPREAHGWQFALSPIFVGLQSQALGLYSGSVPTVKLEYLDFIPILGIQDQPTRRGSPREGRHCKDEPQCEIRIRELITHLNTMI